jgi:hypothetical protein
MYIYNDEKNKMVKETLNVNFGLVKIFDEVLVNALD